MLVVADDKIPFLREVLEPFFRVEYVPGAGIRREHLKDADALIIRTRTKCNRELLEGTRVKFIATATIGFDHIDTQYCAATGIHWTSAPGCNATSVVQYMGSALACLFDQFGLNPGNTTLGIIGAGHVGSSVHTLAQNLGMRVLLNDPPRERVEGPGQFSDLDALLAESDILSFHVPLNPAGIDKTFHMGNHSLFERVKKPFFLVNTSRGEVIDTAALMHHLKTGKIRAAVIDVWENEPNAHTGLIRDVLIATPHIAGYSVEGKANGTAMSVRALSRFFGLGIDNWFPSSLPPPGDPFIKLPGPVDTPAIFSALLASYNIISDSDKLKENTSQFEYLRNHYPVRREYPAYTVVIPSRSGQWERKLNNIGFKTKIHTS